MFLLGTEERGEFTKLQDFLETLRSFGTDGDDDDNVAGVRSHGNRNDIARDKCLDIIIHCHISTL